MIPSLKNILIVRTDRIGDVVLTTPSIAALRQGFPNARISILVAPQTRELVEGNPSVDEIIVDDRKGEHQGILGFWRIVLLLRKRQFDGAIIFHTKKRTNLMCFFAGIPFRIGYHNDKLGFLLTQRLKDTRPKGLKHEAEYCLDVVRHLEVPVGSLKLFVPLKKESEEWADQLFKDHQLIGHAKTIAVHPDASCISKRWPAQKFIEVIEKISETKKANIILIGGPETKKITDEIKMFIFSPVLDVTGQISLSQLASLLKRCDLLISNDSGPVHIAVAVGTPVISIFGRNQAGLSPVRWRSLGKKDIVLHKEVGCEVCLAHRCVINFKCLEEIQPQEVLKAVDTILNPI